MSARRTQARPVPPLLSIGGPNAERDSFLADAFLDTSFYSALASIDDHRWFVVGRTGSGKSAMLQQLEVSFPNKVTRINPSDLAFQYITNQNVVRTLLDMGVSLEPFFKALWRHLILCQVVRHRYQNPPPQVRKSVFQGFREKFSRMPGAEQRLKDIDQLEETFWQTTEQQVKQQIDSLTTTVRAGLSASTPVIPVGVGGLMERVTTEEARAELRERFQRIVNDEAVLRLAKIAVHLSDEALESEHHFTYVVIDDLDLAWVEDNLANMLIRCLLQVALELQRTKYLKVIIALRTNIFEQLDVGAQPRGNQQEKLRSTAMILQWNKTDLETLVDRRLEVLSANLKLQGSLTLAELLPKASQDGVKPFDYIVSRTLLRPRDVILYINRCLDHTTARKLKITWNLLKEVEPTYSRDRLSALRDEWNDPYFDIEAVLQLFHGKPWAMDMGAFGAVAEDIALLLEKGAIGADSKFGGARWLTPLCEPLWAAGANRITWKERCRRLAEFLYSIGFVGFAKERSQNPVFASAPVESFDIYDELGDASRVVVHPAFRLALKLTPPEYGH